LLVDDRPDKLLALEAVLEDLGQNIVRRLLRREALAARADARVRGDPARREHAGMDGFETAQLIRHRKSIRAHPDHLHHGVGDEMLATRGVLGWARSITS
jgi:CheY-like chemotaxis protein